MKHHASRAPLVLAAALLCSFLAVAPVERAAAERPAASADSLRAALAARAAAIFKRSCATAGCHAGAYPKARLALEPEKMTAAVANAPSRQVDTLMLVDTKAPQRSYLLMKLRGTPGIRGKIMPIGAPPLKAADIETIGLWAAGLAAPEPPAAPPAPSGGAEKR